MRRWLENCYGVYRGTGGVVQRQGSYGKQELPTVQPRCLLGNRFEIDPNLIVPDDGLSIDAGAVKPWGNDVSTKTGWSAGFRGQIIKNLKINPKTPWNELPAAKRQKLLYGTGEKKYRVSTLVENALKVGDGALIAVIDEGADTVFSEKAACGYCGISFPELTPQAFSFNAAAPERGLDEFKTLFSDAPR